VGGLICNIEEKGGQAKDGCMNGQQQMGLNHSDSWSYNRSPIIKRSEEIIGTRASHCGDE
jgi:hypothetical protein